MSLKLEKKINEFKEKMIILRVINYIKNHILIKNGVPNLG